MTPTETPEPTPTPPSVASPPPPVLEVLDSSAMLAYLQDEGGAGVVEGLLTTPGVVCYAHAVNLHEVYRRIRQDADQATAESAIRDLYAAMVNPREDMDRALWQDAAELVALARGTPGWHLAMGDGFGLALARRLECEFVTADHPEMEPVVQRGLCAVRFIR